MCSKLLDCSVYFSVATNLLYSAVIRLFQLNNALFILIVSEIRSYENKYLIVFDKQENWNAIRNSCWSSNITKFTF